MACQLINDNRVLYFILPCSLRIMTVTLLQMSLRKKSTGNLSSVTIHLKLQSGRRHEEKQER